MRPNIRRAAHALVAALLIGGLCGFGWLGRVGGNVGAVLQYISSTYTSPLAQNGWVTPGATYTPFVLSGTATGAGSPVITTTTNPGSIVGAEVYDDNYYQTFPFGTTVSSISGTGPYTVTLSQPSAAATPPNSAVGLWISPAYPVAQWTWDAAKTTNQPPNALSGGGGTALATFATGVPDGTAAITGVNNVFGASAGWWATSGALSAPAQIASISGSSPNYAITLVTGGNALIRDATSLAPVTIQPDEPTIIEYRNSAAKPDGTAGTTPAATFSGYVVNTTLNVTSTPTAALAVGTPIYYPTIPADIPQGAYITACPGGVCTGTGAYTISDSIAAGVVGTSGSPVALQTMGQVGTFHTAYGYGGHGGAFSYLFGYGPTYEPGDVFAVLPAIYAGVWEWFSLVSAEDGPNCGITTTAGSAYVSYDCASSATDGLAVGDTVRDSAQQSPLVGYINGTTFTVLGTPAPGGISIAQVGEPLSGGGVATGTIITACGAAGCAYPGNFTVGCETGYSGTCNTQTLGSASAPVALMAQGNWPLTSSASIAAVYTCTTSGTCNASCPNGVGYVCIQVSPVASYTKVSADNWTVWTNRPMQGVTVEGITGPINGSGAYRPAITEDSDGDSNAYWQLGQGMLWIGAYDYNGYVNNPLVRNIDLESNGLTGTEYLLWFSTGITGTTTLSQMRLEGQIWSTNADSYGNGSTGDAIHSADVNIFAVSDLFADPAALTPMEQQSGTLNLENDILDLNGGSQGPQHNVYMGAAPNWTCNFINVWSYKATAGHLLKSRCGTTNVIGSYLQGGDSLSGLSPPQFTASIEASGPTGLPTLVVSNITSGALYPGQTIMASPGSPTAVTAATEIMQFIAGTGTPGGAASYTVACASGGPGSCSQTVPSEAMEGNYYNDSGLGGPIIGESVNAEFPCGGDVTVENTIMTKGMGGGTAPQDSNPDTINYGAEQQYYANPMTVATGGVPLGSSTATFTTAIPAVYNDGLSTSIGDATNPNAFPWGSPISNIGSNSLTIDIQEGEVFTASFSGTSMDVTALASGTGAISVGAPLWDASGLIPAATTITACPGGVCSAYQIPTPAVAPTTGTSTSFAEPETVYVKYTYTVGSSATDYAETPASPDAGPITIASGNTLVVNPPSGGSYAPADANGYNVYLATSAGGTYYLQNTAGPVAIGTAWTQSAAMNTSSAHPPAVNATGTYTISQSAGTIASETAQTGCGSNVCQPIAAGDTILLWRECPWGAKALNKLYVLNNDFVNFHSTYELDYGHQPIQVVGDDRIAQLPGDAAWPFSSPSDWSVTDNIFAGFPAGANNPNSGQDNSADTAAGNLNLYFADWPWTGTAAAGQGANAHVQLVTSPAEFTQSFQQTFVPHYGDASGNIVGILSYVHAAMEGVARGDEALGAAD